MKSTLKNISLNLIILLIANMSVSAQHIALNIAEKTESKQEFRLMVEEIEEDLNVNNLQLENKRFSPYFLSTENEQFVPATTLKNIEQDAYLYLPAEESESNLQISSFVFSPFRIMPEHNEQELKVNDLNIEQYPVMPTDIEEDINVNDLDVRKLDVRNALSLL